MGEVEIDRCYLMDLPNELVERIFSYLDLRAVLRLEMSCAGMGRKTTQYWRKLKHIHLLPFLKTHAPGALNSAMKFDRAGGNLVRRTGPWLTGLDLSKFGPMEYGLRCLLESAVLYDAPHLQHISLNSRLLEKEWLCGLAKSSAASLRSLSLDAVYIRGDQQLSDKILNPCLCQWTQLEWLSLCDNKLIHVSHPEVYPRTLSHLQLTGSSVDFLKLAELLTRCSELRVLSISYSQSLRVVDPTLLTNLTQLRLKGADSTGYDVDLRPTLRPLNRLQSLTLDSYLLSDSLFQVIALEMTDLVEISFPGGRHALGISSVSENLAAIADNLRSLYKISFRGNSWSGKLMLMLGRFSSKLRVVDVSYGVREREMEGHWDLVQSPSLELLVMQGLAPPNRPLKRADVWSRLTGCPLLRRLVLSARMRYVQPFGMRLFRGIEGAQLRVGTAKTVLVKDNDVETAFRVLNRLMSKEGLLGVVRRTERFEKPYKQRQRAAFSTCRSIYDEDMERKISFLLRKNRKDPSPGLY